MKAILLKCPNCGAAMHAAPSSDTATCEYCHKQARVQLRTGVFARPQKLPRHAPSQLPVATQARTPWWIVGWMSALVTVGAVVPFAMKSNSCRPEALKKLERPQWSGVQGGVLVDLNGDGVEDLIGRARVIQPQLRAHLVALDGASGERLWLSESLGDEQNAYQAPLGLIDGTVLIGDGAAGLHAYLASDGSPRWKLRLNEKVVDLCLGEAGPMVRTADDQGHPLSITDGTAAAAIPLAERDCVRLPGDDVRHAFGAGVVPIEWSGALSEEVVRDRIEGMSASKGLRHLSSSRMIAIGHKDPGTRVGMLASYAWPEKPAETYEELWARSNKTKDRAQKEALRQRARLIRNWSSERAPIVDWKVAVPGVDPLSVQEGAPEFEELALTDTHLLVAYQTKSSGAYRLTAFDPTDGRRLWDVAVSGDRPWGGVMISSTHAYVSRWGTLEAFALDTGARAFWLD